MKKPDFSRLKTSFSEHYHNLGSAGKSLVFTVLAAFAFMILICLAVFFGVVRGAEKMTVPAVTGMRLEEGLLELQAKGMTGKISLKYTDNPEDKGLILSQSPAKKSIVKIPRVVELTVSRGAVLDKVGDYKGKNIEEVRMLIKSAFSGKRQLILVADPVYRNSSQEEGTILQQSIEPGTKITEPVTIQFIVSRGGSVEKTSIPNLVGKNFTSALSAIASSKIIFDFTERPASAGEIMGTVCAQSNPESESVDNYTRVSAEVLTGRDEKNNKVYGLYSVKLPVYPIPLSVRLEAVDSEGNKTTLADILHTGGNLTIPYEVEDGSTLILYVADKESSRKTVE